MKNWFMLVLCALMMVFAFGCVSSDTSDDPTDDSTVETSTTTSDLTLSCAGRCTAEYNSCMTEANDSLDTCFCRNGLKACRRACGLTAAPLEKCFLN